MSRARVTRGEQGLHAYLGGDGGDVVVAGNTVFFIEYNGNRVTAWVGASTDPADVANRNPTSH